METRSPRWALFLLAALSSKPILLTEASLENAYGPPIDFLTGLQYTAYQKGPTCSPTSPILYPQTTSDIQAIILTAAALNTTVKAFGHRHSATDIICTDGIPIDMRAFQEFSYDAATQTVTVGGGMYLYDATQAMALEGRAIRTMPAWGNVTIAGAMGTGAHGSTLRYNASISDQVVALTIVDGTGTVRQITSDSPDLPAFRLHLGLLGVIINVTLYTVPLYKVTAVNTVVNDDILLNGQLLDMVRAADQTTVYWYPSLGKLVIGNWTIVDPATPGEAWTSDHVPPTSDTHNLYAVPSLEIIQTLNDSLGLQVFQVYTLASMYTDVPDFAPIYTTNGLTVSNPATGFYDVMFAPICQETGFWACPWFHAPNQYSFTDNEIDIDVRNLTAFAADMNQILATRTAAFPFDGVLLRFSRASETLMSTSLGRDTCHVEFYMMRRRDSYNDTSTGLASYQAILQTLAYKYRGGSHWGKSGPFYHSSEMLDLKLNPAARSSFISVMEKYDPNGIFLNNFGRRLLETSSDADIDPATTHCALLDNCVCAEDSDCAAGTHCQKFSPQFNYNVCVNPNEPNIPINLGSITALANYNGALNLQQILCANTLSIGHSTLNSALKCPPLLGGLLPTIG